MTTARKRSAKAGLPPGSLIHVGRRHAQETRVTVTAFNEDSIETWEPAAGDPLPPWETSERVIWVNVAGLRDAARVEDIGRHFRLHPLVLEDILNTEQRPKLEHYQETLYLVLKTFQREGHGRRLEYEQVSLVLGSRFVLSFFEADSPAFHSVLDRIKAGKGQIRRQQADFLLYSLVDAVVDSYFVVLEGLIEQVESLETSVVDHPRPEVIHGIHALRREAVQIRRTLWPLREVLNSLQRGESPLIERWTLLFLRDVYDHAVHIIESVEIQRDLVTGMLEIYVSTVSYRLGVVMKILTVITTVFMPLTLIAGLYGMNFSYLPGKDYPLGFAAVLAVMLIIGGAMLWLFRRKGWL